MSKNPAISLLQKIILALLIFSAGLVGPLAYFDAYSPHHVANNTAHLTVLQDGAAANRLAATLRSMRRKQWPSLLSRQNQQLSALERTLIVPELVKNLQLALGSYYPALHFCHIQAQQLCLASGLGDFLIISQSAQLPPPDKPPQLL